MKKLLTLSCLFALAGCTSLQTISISSIPQKRDMPVEAQASKVIFLGFNFDNDFADEVTTDLKKQCPDGMISGILTKDEVVDYFLMIVWKHRVTAKGFCVKAGRNAQTSVTGTTHEI